tara:strand:- start:4414 stop:4926 length:513 start_codon:yes stop_codon:yes gene_type:complete
MSPTNRFIDYPIDEVAKLVLSDIGYSRTHIANQSIHHKPELETISESSNPSCQNSLSSPVQQTSPLPPFPSRSQQQNNILALVTTMACAHLFKRKNKPNPASTAENKKTSPPQLPRITTDEAYRSDVVITSYADADGTYYGGAARSARFGAKKAFAGVEQPGNRKYEDGG